MDSESPLNRSLYAAQQGRATRPLRPIAAETKLIGYYFKQLMAVPAAAEISRLIMAFYKDERLALFIDGANLYSSARALGLEIDFRKFLKEFQGRGRLLRASYYTALVESDEYSPIRPLVDWLAYNGFSVVKKAAREYTDREGRKRHRGNMDVELAVDMLEAADHTDHIVLFSGNGDFRRLIEAVKAKGVRVSVVSTNTSSPPMVADDLRREADAFIELEDIAEMIARPRRDQPDAPALDEDD
jgi:uncharacterized LabA/DUF88 family protein